MKKNFCVIPTSFLIFLALVPAALTQTQEGQKFEVLARGGAPVIAIDGTPVRSRVFFGRPGSSLVSLGQEFQTIQFDFVANQESQGKGTFHFRFGTEPGMIVLDNFSVVEKESGKIVAGEYDFERDEDLARWQAWHTRFNDAQIATIDAEENVGTNGSRALVVRLNEFPKEWTPDFHLFHQRTLQIEQGKTYVVKFDARTDASFRSITVDFYRPDSPSYVKLGTCGSSVLSAQVKLAASAGVDFVSFLPNVKTWPRPDGSYDFEPLDSVCDEILRANPNALLIPRLKIDADKEWLDAHPDARAVWKKAGKDHDGQGWDWASPASPEYRRTACETLAATIRHLESKYGDSIAGYHPCGQNTSEWFTPNTWTAGYAGFSEADRVAFRKWLQKKYQTNDALKRAWTDPQATFNSAEVPSVEERDASRQKIYVESQKLLDFNEYWQEAMTDVIVDLARVVKRETSGRKLTFFFYGYSYEFSSVSKGPAASAHYALRNLLDCPDVDVICSPISYSDRQLGGSCSCMLDAESVALAGKLYLYEDDSRTFIAHATNSRLASTTNLEDSVSVLLRNSGESALRNFGTWLMDLGGVGWYNSSELWRASASLTELDRYFLENPTPYAPEIGVFLDEKSMLKFSEGASVYPTVGALRQKLGQIGAPYAQYALEDLTSGRIAPPKLCVVLIYDALDAQTREKIENIVKGKNVRLLSVGLIPPSLEELRTAAQEANVWIYTDKPCVVWANEPFVMVVAPQDGEYKFQAPPGKKSIVDYFSGKPLSSDGRLVLALKLGDVRILRLE